jgi:translation initiation factor 2B subunit (eIF-2B alpha/beta/delta family)
MTAASEWRDWPSWRRLNAIARLPVTGAAAAGGLAARSMAEFVETLVEYAPDAYPGAVERVADELLAHQPAIAPLVSLVNTVFLEIAAGPKALIQALRETERRIATSVGMLSAVGAALVEEGAGVLTFGASGSVRAVLIAAGRERRFFVSCAATMPGGEGVEMAADLAVAGLQVELVPDDELPEVLLGCDLVMLGASAIGPGAVMNYVGAAALVREARSAGVPVYTVASVEKALPGPLFSRAVAAGSADGRFGPIPLDHLEAVVTEFGILDPVAAGTMAAERTVAERLISGGA